MFPGVSGFRAFKVSGRCSAHNLLGGVWRTEDMMLIHQHRHELVLKGPGGWMESVPTHARTHTHTHMSI